MLKLNPELSDQVWNSMIIMALDYHRRIGSFHNERYDRKFVYIAINIHEMAKILVNNGVIHSWPAGFRRLITIRGECIDRFTSVHGKTYLDT